VTSTKKREKPLRLHCVGGHATGKTTLTRWISSTYRLPMLGETARVELAKREISFDRLRVDVAATTQYQHDVFTAQLAAERGRDRFVADRAFFDNLAYMSRHGRGLRDILQSAPCRNAAVQMRRSIEAGATVLFFVRPHEALMKRDGFRAEGDLDVAGVWAVDGAVQFMLEMWGLDYVPIEGISFKERQRLVEAVLKDKT